MDLPTSTSCFYDLSGKGRVHALPSRAPLRIDKTRFEMSLLKEKTLKVRHM